METAVQPIPPKQLTDEELKQQYGIHMTSRIQEDGGGTEAKWADIDDDEDDWAPETIEWTDGTKVTLTHTDHPPPATDHTLEEAKDAVPLPEQTVATDSIKIVAPKPTTSVGPNPTVLRLGANAERQAKAASISSKGTNDRAPSGSTSPAPPPAKSPWAPLPPVERVSPVNPPAHVSQQPRGPGPFSHPARDDVRHAPFPPQEIAADDFNRTWRETTPGAPRELYNSRSGRYEPVQDNRRGSWRHDQGPRPPAVLQRPNQAEPGGPAEPSAAFQTHRSSHQEGTGWNRRRTSSNVSGGSGGFGRRMSFGRTDAPPRYIEGRRGSQTNGMGDPALMERDHGPHGEPHTVAGWGGQAPRSASVASSVEPPQAASVPMAEAPQEDPVVLQERIMKDARAQARQRRLEQEEKDRLEREERIKKKLAALGPPPEKTRPPPEKSLPHRKEAAEVHINNPSSPAPAILHSPPKPPVPEPSGEPKQYGLMKVHHPDSVKKLVAVNERDRATEKHPEKPTSPHTRRVPLSPRDQKRELPTAPTTAKQPSSETHPTDVKADEHGPDWRGNLNTPSSYPPWSSNTNLASNPASVKNPWSLLNSDRTLGNGIFDQSLGAFPSREIPLRSQFGMDQPTMPPQAFSGPQESAPVSPLPSPETRHARFGPLNPIGRPGPIGPPSQKHQWQRDARSVPWAQYGSIAEHDRAVQEQAREAFKANRGKPNPHLANIKETWKPLRGVPDETAKKAVIDITPGTVDNSNNGPAPANPLTGLDAPADGLAFTESPARPIASVPARSSRFFPQASEQSKRVSSEKHDHQRSPSPPPPEDGWSHPVYGGSSGRPLVHLPNPKPVVKLPPKALAVSAAPAAPAAPPTFASMAAASPARGQAAPASTAISWQEKINGLLGKKTPVEKKSALAITSATKEPLDVTLPVAAVSVSLPNIESDAQVRDGHVAVRQVEEQDEIFEDREPGSLPSVRVPNMAPANAWQAAPAPPLSRQRAKVLKPMQVHSIETYSVGLGEKDAAGNTCVVVQLPGTATAKTMSMPKKAGGPTTPRQQQQQQQQRSSASSFNKSRKGPKPREASGNNGPKKPSSSSQQQSRTGSWGTST